MAMLFRFHLSRHKQHVMWSILSIPKGRKKHFVDGIMSYKMDLIEFMYNVQCIGTQAYIHTHIDTR